MSQRLIPTGERSGLLTHIPMTESNRRHRTKQSRHRRINEPDFQKQELQRVSKNCAPPSPTFTLAVTFGYLPFLSFPVSG